MSPQKDLSVVRRLAALAIDAGDPLSWFETLYVAAERGEAVIPWADSEPNPSLLRWTADNGLAGHGRRALVIGCGAGDDAEALAGLGFSVVAFDVSPAAVRLCRSRFPDTAVEYVAADLLAPPEGWTAAFDFVFEANTVQALPEGALRKGAIEALSTFVAPGGTLLVVARGRDEDEPLSRLPWPLTPAEVRACGGDRLNLRSFDDFLDRQDPPVRRFLAVFG
jgi:SAM-dependent methyltransferase